MHLVRCIVLIAYVALEGVKVFSTQLFFGLDVVSAMFRSEFCYAPVPSEQSLESGSPFTEVNLDFQEMYCAKSVAEEGWF